MINLPAIELIEISPTEIIPAPLESKIWAEFLTLQISAATRKSYAASLKDFFRRRFDRAVSPEVIEEFLSCSEYDALTHVLAYRGQLLEAGLSSGTVNTRLAALKSFVTHAAKRKLCTFRLDDIKSVKAQSYKDTRGISIEQFRFMIDAIDRSTSLGKRNYAIMRLLWDNAFRRAEVCGLDRSDFRPGEARLYLKGKGRIDKEPIDLASRTVDAISDWLTSFDATATNPALFLSSRDRRLAPEAVYDIVSSLAESAGIDRKVSPHMIRHSSITALLDANGGDVRSAQAHSRHKDLSTLIRYDDNRQELQGKSARILADLV
jgi:integrase/recombinase XerC